ncbi:hypothetical protein GFS60_02792 [Rhodococcus sp. WAY2]|nr:hypothetical protein GFS60_02792 [Rhodococcus sp. WAY2]
MWHPPCPRLRDPTDIISPTVTGRLTDPKYHRWAARSVMF